MTKSHKMRKVHNPAAAKKVYRAGLALPALFFSSLFPLPTPSVVSNESATN